LKGEEAEVEAGERVFQGKIAWEPSRQPEEATRSKEDGRVSTREGRFSEKE